MFYKLGNTQLGAMEMVMELNEVIKGDCLEVMKGIPTGSVDMILCDLPYGTTKCKWDIVIPFEPLWEQYERVIKDNGAIVLFSKQPFTSHLLLSNQKLFRYEMIWDKVHPSNFVNANKMPLTQHENILVFYKKLPTYNPIMVDAPKENIRYTIREGYQSSETIPIKKKKTGADYNPEKRYPKSILTKTKQSSDCRNKNKFHPTQKPVPLFEYLIETFTNKGDIVLDNCMGSGTTAVSAIRTGRKFIGIEKEEGYVDIARQRISDAMKTEVSEGESV